MSLELQVLAWSVALGFVHIVAASHSSALQRGYRWSAGPRDQPVAPLTGIAARLERALRNYLETFPLFAALALTVQLSGRHGAVSEWGAMLYLAGRVVYLPLYACGVPYVRSMAWNVAALGMLLLMAALVF